MSESSGEKPIIMVSSTVYGIEELPERMYTILTAFGYEVWMSHKGTLPVFSKLTAFQNCLKAVEKCHLFLGLLSHDHVVFARSLLKDLGYGNAETRKRLKLRKGSTVFGDLRVIDMYEEAVLSERPLGQRRGNWVQKFGSDSEALLFATAQFSRYQEVETFLRENFYNPAKVMTSLRGDRT
jgi:hypothetical protein